MKTVNMTVATILKATILMAVSIPAASGELITQLDIAVTDAYTYVYIVRNNAGSGGHVASFALNVSSSAALTGLTGPAGWDIGYEPGAGVITWVASSPETLLIPGSSAVFGFTSTLAPALQDYVIVGVDPVTFEVVANLGQTLSPAIPEPSSFWFVCAPLTGLVYILRRRVRPTRLLVCRAQRVPSMR